MALPKDVTDALMDMATVCPQEEVFGDRVANWLSPIREHLLNQYAEIERYKVAWTEYNDRTEWVQKTAKPKELGLHRADVLRLRIESAESRLAAANERLEAAERDAARWRHARKLLTVDDIEGAQGSYDSFGRLVSEDECKRADDAIDAATQEGEG